MRRKHALMLATPLALLLLDACIAAAPPVGSLTKPLALAHGKRSAPVEVRFSKLSHLAANVPVDLSVDLIPGIDADEILLSFVPSAGLQVSAGNPPAPLSAVVKGQTYRRTVTLIAPADGEYRLGVLATLRVGTTQQTRAVSQRLSVGAAAHAKPALRRDANQVPIEASPAQERISH